MPVIIIIKVLYQRELNPVALINPFDYVNKDEVKKRVEKLKRKKPGLSREEISRLIVRKKCRLCAAAGAVSAVPGAVPGLGTLVALVGGTVLDVIAVGYFISEMIMEVAAVHNRDLEGHDTTREAVWVFVSAVGAGAAGKGLTRAAVSQLSGRAFTRLFERVLLTLGFRVTQRTIFRIIPFIGIFIIGAVNFYTCEKVGEYVIKYYDKNEYYDRDRDGKTIDIDAEITGE